MALPWPSWLPSSLDTVKTKTAVQSWAPGRAARRRTGVAETIVSARLGTFAPQLHGQDLVHVHRGLELLGDAAKVLHHRIPDAGHGDLHALNQVRGHHDLAVRAILSRMLMAWETVALELDSMEFLLGLQRVRFFLEGGRM